MHTVQPKHTFAHLISQCRVPRLSLAAYTINMGKILLLSIITLLAGCSGDSGPSSTDTSSDRFATLAEKVAFLQQYVTFRYNYRSLDFRITYHNNSTGLVPGPSDWNIRIVAKVPPADLATWTSGLTRVSKADTSWLSDVPTSINYSGVSEWFQSDYKIVGIDTKSAVVVYKNSNM